MKGLFTYDMIRDIWIPLLSGIIGGLFTLVGVVLTVRYERKKEQRDYMEKIKPLFSTYQTFLKTKSNT